MMKNRIMPALLAAAVLGLFCGRNNAGCGCACDGGADGRTQAFPACHDAATAELLIEIEGAERTDYASRERDTAKMKVSPAARDAVSPAGRHSGGWKTSTGAGSGGVFRKTAEVTTSDRTAGEKTAAADTDTVHKTAERYRGAIARRSSDKSGGVTATEAKKTVDGYSPATVESKTKTAATGTGSSSKTAMRKTGTVAQGTAEQSRSGRNAGTNMKTRVNTMTAAADNKEAATGLPEETVAADQKQNTAAALKKSYAAPGGLLEKPRVEPPPIQ